jgi:uncharacterized membrane protein (DUF485 family)
MKPNTDGHPIVSMLTEIRKYVETRIDLIQYKAIDKSAHLASSLISSVILLFGSFLAIFLLTFGAAFFVGELLGKTSYGFFAVGGFVLLLVILLIVFRRRWLNAPITDNIIKDIFN